MEQSLSVRFVFISLNIEFNFYNLISTIFDFRRVISKMNQFDVKANKNMKRVHNNENRRRTKSKNENVKGK